MFKIASLAVAAALLLVGLAGRAEAVVMIDPGPAGGQSNSPLVSDVSLLGGQTNSFHYVFEDMKHVETIGWGWALSDIFDPSDPPFLSWIYYLTDMSGNEIDGTRSESQGSFSVFISGSSEPIIAHDFYIEITPDRDILVDIFVEGLVGEWVALPVPATIALFGFGLAGLGLASLRGSAPRRYRATGEMSGKSD